MRIIKTRKFAKWAQKNDLTDRSITNAAQEIAHDIYEAHYGGGVIKKRIANKGRGKSSSARTIVAFKKEKYCYFIFGFEKTDKDNITLNEEKTLKLIAKSLLAYTNEELEQFILEGLLIEVKK